MGVSGGDIIAGPADGAKISVQLDIIFCEVR